MDIKTLTSGALIKHPSRGLLLGTGPFRESAEPPESGPAFYIDTFRLDDPRPWKIPAALHALPAEENPPRLLRKSGGRNRLRTHTRRFLRK